MKKIASVLTAVAFAVMATGCGSAQDEYVGVCVDPTTQVRLDEDACDSGDSDYLSTAVLWYMLANSSHSYPGYGERVHKSYFKTSKPKGAYVYKKALPKSGGSSLKSYTSKSKSFGGGTSTGSSSKSGWGSSKSSSGGSSWKSGGSSTTKSYSSPPRR